MHRTIVVGVVVAIVGLAAGPSAARAQGASAVVTPEEHFGFRPGADRKLADYDQITSWRPWWMREGSSCCR